MVQRWFCAAWLAIGQLSIYKLDLNILPKRVNYINALITIEGNTIIHIIYNLLFLFAVTAHLPCRKKSGFFLFLKAVERNMVVI